MKFMKCWKLFFIRKEPALSPRESDVLRMVADRSGPVPDPDLALACAAEALRKRGLLAWNGGMMFGRYEVTPLGMKALGRA